MIEVVALARALTHAGEHRDAAMRLRDVVDQLLDQHRLADAGAAEQANLAALQVGGEQIDHLDARDQDLRRRRLVLEARRLAMDRVALLARHRPALVHRFADHVHDPPERLRPHRHGDRAARVGHFLAAHQPVGAVHGDAAHRALAQFLRHFQHQGAVAHLGVQRVLDERQLAFELHVDHGAEHLRHAPDIVAGHLESSCLCHAIKRLRRRR